MDKRILELGGWIQMVSGERKLLLSSPSRLTIENMAERVGFEPTLPFRVNTLSKRAPSATRPSLRRELRKDQPPGNSEQSVQRSSRSVRLNRSADTAPRCFPILWVKSWRPQLRRTNAPLDGQTLRELFWSVANARRQPRRRGYASGSRAGRRSFRGVAVSL